MKIYHYFQQRLNSIKLKDFCLTLFILSFIIYFPLNAQKWSTQKGGHCYTMEIPDYLIKTFDLNDVASLQYKNEAKEAYVIVIEDNKQHLESLGMKFLNAEDFLENFLQDYRTEGNREFTPVANFQANGNDFSQVEMTWEQENLAFFMLVTSVETKTHFYKVLCWTIKENRNMFIDDFKKIAKSLKD